MNSLAPRIEARGVAMERGGEGEEKEKGTCTERRGGGEEEEEEGEEEEGEVEKEEEEDKEEEERAGETKMSGLYREEPLRERQPISGLESSRMG